MVPEASGWRCDAVPRVTSCCQDGRKTPSWQAELKLLLTLLLVAVLATVAPGQTLTQTFTGPPFAAMPDRFTSGGDLDGDGVPDLLAGDSQPGSVFVFSGADGRIVHTINGPLPFSGYGKALAGNVDVNGDQVPDILVGAYTDGQAAGHVYLYSGASFSLIRQHTGSPGENLGRPVAFLDDLNGDGVPEYASGAHQGGAVPPPLAGKAYVYSGSSGSILFALSGTQSGDYFGCAIASLGLIDEDSVPDFAVGSQGFDAPTKGSCGAVFVYSGRTGQLIRKDEGLATGNNIGKSIVPMGDLNEDGKGDYVTSWSPGTNGAIVFSGADGVILSSMQADVIAALAPEVGSVNDLDGDGGRDVALATWGPDGRSNGYMSMVGSLSGKELLRVEDPVQLFNDNFPAIAKSIGDLDGDMREEVAGVDLFDDPQGGGSIYAFSMPSLLALEAELSASAGGAVPLVLDAGDPHGGAQYFVLASLSPIGTSCSSGPSIGPLQLQLPFCLDLVSQYSVILGLAGQPPFVNTFGSLDPATGTATATFDMRGIHLPPQTVGFSFHFAFVARDPERGHWDFVSNNEQILIVP